MPDSYDWMQPGDYSWMNNSQYSNGGDAGPQDNPGYAMWGLGNMSSPWAQETGFQGNPYLTGGTWDSPESVFNPEYQQYLQNNNYTFAPGYSGADPLSSLFKNGNYQGTKQVTSGDSVFGTVMNTLGSAFLGGAMGPGGALGLGGTASGALGGGVFGGMTGGAQGALRGAVTGGLTGSNPAQLAGIENQGLQKMFNSGLGGTTSALLGGSSLPQALTAGATSAGVSGLKAFGGKTGSFMSDIFDKFSGDGELGDLPGNMVTGNDPYNATPEQYSDEGARFDTSAGLPYGYAPQGQGNSSLPDQQAQSFSPSSFSMPNMGDVGGFVGNHLGDLATGLYGIYNNRRQQKALSGQMNQMQDWYNKNSATNQTAMKTLQDLYSNNSPYAAQLRNKLTAQAAATGRRSNISGRETQMQAALADKYASILPQLTSMQNQQNSMGSALAQANMQAQQQRALLQNRMMGNILNMGNQTGAFKGLGSLFGNGGTQEIPYNYGNVSGSDMFGYKGAGGF